MVELVSRVAVIEGMAKFIEERFPVFTGSNVTADTLLLEGGAIDSLGMLELITHLEEQYGIVMDDEDFQPENLETLGALADLVVAK